jgi:DNA-binding NarL/FixJ family response regulator
METRTSDTYRNMIGIEQPHYEHILAEATAQLGKETFTALWIGGHNMTTEQALAAQGLEEAPPDTFSATLLPIPIPSAIPPARLTKREFEVLRLVAKGLTNAQIAERLVISLTTVSSYLSSIYGKLGVSSRLGAMRYVIDHRLL